MPAALSSVSTSVLNSGNSMSPCRGAGMGKEEGEEEEEEVEKEEFVACWTASGNLAGCAVHKHTIGNNNQKRNGEKVLIIMWVSIKVTYKII